MTHPVHWPWWTLPALGLVLAGVSAIVSDRRDIDAFGRPLPTPQSFLGAWSLLAGVLLLVFGSLSQLLH